MLDEALIEEIVTQVLYQLECDQNPKTISEWTHAEISEIINENLTDITSAEEKSIPLLEAPEDREALLRMMHKTAARIGVGRAGPRNKTKTMLTLRADHAAARDAVFTDVNQALLKKLNLLSFQTLCNDKNEHITRPDLGRLLSPENIDIIKSRCKSGQDVQIIASDGLSSKAIEANLENILPVILDGLKAQKLSFGETFFVKYGRVAVEDQIAQALQAKVVCILIGERPGLATAESMSAYICYNAQVGQPESRRTVVSNIHSGGISGVEAGAYISELIGKILERKVSGVDLKQ